MKNKLYTFKQHYESALMDYLASVRESVLKEAYELGRQAIADGFGVLDIAAVHYEILPSIVINAHSSEENTLILKQTGDFFIECLSPFEITHRGFQEANVTLHTLNDNLKQSTIKLENLNKELETFSYSVSHDLRAPLRAIYGFSKIILEDYEEKLDENGKSVLRTIYSNAQKMGQLITDILNFSRISRREFKRVKINMNLLIREVIDEFKNTLPEKKHIFTVTDVPNALGDYIMLKEVWRNLVSNAIKFSSIKEKPIIEIGAFESHGEQTYFIKDNGVGFDMKYKGMLFEIFQRLHSEQDFEGTGVGLSIVKRIIEKHRGRVWGEGEVGKGATFYFTLPLKEDNNGIQR